MRFPLLATALLAACDTSVVVGDLEEVTTLRAVQNRNLDILFVVDNSASMTEQQSSLAGNFPRMIDVLEQLDGGLPNLHIGVVTSDMGTSASQTSPGPGVGTIGVGGCAGYGDNGALQHRSMLLSNGATFISDVAGPNDTREKNYTGALRDVFGEIALVGATGCGFEQHLSSMRQALANQANSGFLRPDANLAVVIIADEDDCSLLDSGMLGIDTGTTMLGPLHSFRCTRFGVTCDEDINTIGPKTDCKPRSSSQYVEDVQPFVNALLAAKENDARRVMVAAIVGEPTPVNVDIVAINGQNQTALTPSCTFQGLMGPETADPGVRLAAFVDAFPGRSTLTSICNSDLSGALLQIGGTAKKLMNDPCLDASSMLADSSPDPGIQPACEVLDVRDSAPSSPITVPPCSADSTDCFEITADPVACPTTPENLRVRFRRSFTPELDTWTHVRCQLAK